MSHNSYSWNYHVVGRFLLAFLEYGVPPMQLIINYSQEEAIAIPIKLKTSVPFPFPSLQVLKIPEKREMGKARDKEQIMSFSSLHNHKVKLLAEAGGAEEEKVSIKRIQH